ncbi:MAG: hypothetical protein WKF57_03730 [Nakamurella sp.]
MSVATWVVVRGYFRAADPSGARDWLQSLQIISLIVAVASCITAALVYAVLRFVIHPQRNR